MEFGEGIRLYKNKLVHLNKHLERLYEGADLISMKIGVKPEDLKKHYLPNS